MMRWKSLVILIPLLIGITLLIGCVQEPAKPTPTPTVAPTETPVYTSTYTPTPLPATQTPSGKEVIIWINSYSFQPREKTIEAGTKVIWWNQIHDRYEDIVVLAEDRSWNSTPFGQYRSWNRTFYTPGVYNYTATFSGTELKNLHGEITVTP